METGNNPDFEKKRNEACNETFQQVKKGNRSYRESFIGEHETFVLSVVCEHVGDSTIKKNSEEFHVGLFAFIYSIDKFTQDNYEEFIEYSKGVIKSWLDDYRVKNLKSFRDDVAHLKHKLWEFGITIPQLISSTPKDNLSIKAALKNAKDILNTESLFANLKIDKNLSVEELAGLNAVISRKVKNNRKYTIALIMILKSNLDVLRNYLKNIEADDIIADNIGTVIERTKDTAIYMTGYGRFNMTNSFGNVVDLGKMVYFTKSNLKSGVKVPGSKYTLAAAGIVLLAVVAFTGFKFIDGGRNQGTPTVVSIADKDKDASNESDNEKNVNPTPIQSADAANTPVTEVTENPTPIPTEAVVAVPSPTVKDVFTPTKVQNSVSTPTLIKPTAKPTTKQTAKPTAKPTTKPTVKPTTKPTAKPTTKPTNKPTTKPTEKPSVKPTSAGYATTKATGVPGAIQISSDRSEVKVGESYTIHMIMPGGNNATQWKLYEDGKSTLTRSSPDNSPGEQHIQRMIIAKKAGTYTYKCEASNSYGTTTSSTITVTVK